MSEIKITVNDQYLGAFVEFLKTLDYVTIKMVGGQKQNGGAAPSNNALAIIDQQAAKFAEPLSDKTDLRNLLIEQGYKGPNKDHFKQLVKELSIKEPIEDLLSQLTK